jgi:excisionase family DNA binding protein
MASAQNRDWISFSEAGRRIGTSKHTVRRLADRGSLTVLKMPGAHPRVKSSELDRLARENTSTSRHASPAWKQVSEMLLQSMDGPGRLCTRAVELFPPANDFPFADRLRFVRVTAEGEIYLPLEFVGIKWMQRAVQKSPDVDIPTCFHRGVAHVCLSWLEQTLPEAHEEWDGLSAACGPIPRSPPPVPYTAVFRTLSRREPQLRQSWLV